MVVLTITHTDDLRAVEDLVGVLTRGGATAVNATRPGHTAVTFPREPDARVAGATIISLPAVTGVAIEVP